MKPRRLPRIGAGTSTKNQNQNQDPNIITNNNISPKKKRNLDSIRKKNSGDPDYIKKYRRIRDRHQEDFAISLSPNQEDIISEDVRLYDNKDIHLETQKMKENMGFENTEYYIESIHHDQYYKINQIRKEEKKPEEILGEAKVGQKKRRRSVHKKFTAFEQAQADEICYVSGAFPCCGLCRTFAPRYRNARSASKCNPGRTWLYDDGYAHKKVRKEDLRQQGCSSGSLDLVRHLLYHSDR